MLVPNNVPADFWKQANFYKFIYSIIGLIGGLGCIVGGIVLFLNGITGHENWVVKILNIESNISDAAPGALLFVISFYIIRTTRYTIRVKK